MSKTQAKKTRCIGILTSGGDCPGLNAAIRAITKTAVGHFGIQTIGFLEGFRGLVENRAIPLDDSTVSGLLTQGGTLLGASRDKLHKMPMGGRYLDMTHVAVENAREHHIDCLVCLGGGGTQKQAWRLATEGGIPVLTLPKTIDNDVVETDVSFGYDTAMSIATEAVDRLHTTATSHHRIIVCEVMGHKSGWLALGAGMAGGADVILIPEIPYRLDVIGEYLRERRRSGKRFSIVVVAEGAMSAAEVEAEAKQRKRATKSKRGRGKSKPAVGNGNGWGDETRDGLPVVFRRVANELRAYHVVQEPMASRIARQLQDLTGTEARVTTLGHVQRGGVPTPFDRMLCTRLGTRAAELLAEGVFNVMVGYQNGQCVPVPLERVVGLRKTVPLNHPAIASARLLGTCLGDQGYAAPAASVRRRP